MDTSRCLTVSLTILILKRKALFSLMYHSSLANEILSIYWMALAPLGPLESSEFSNE